MTHMSCAAVLIIATAIGEKSLPVDGVYTCKMGSAYIGERYHGARCRYEDADGNEVVVTADMLDDYSRIGMAHTMCGDYYESSFSVAIEIMVRGRDVSY